MRFQARLFLSIFMTMVYTVLLSGQQVDNIIATDFLAEGKVVEIDLPPEMEGMRFVIAWSTEKENGGLEFFARPGRHTYDLRHHKTWKGKVRGLASNLPKNPQIKSKLISPSFSDELDMFFSPEYFAPTSINFLSNKSLFGMNWTKVLFVLAILSGLFFFFYKKQSLYLACWMGIVVSFFILDLRSLSDHAHIVQQGEKHHPYMPPFNGVQMFAEAARPVINHNPWTTQGNMDGLLRLYLKYILADAPFVNNKKNINTETYIITTSPNNNQTILEQKAGYFLVQNK